MWLDITSACIALFEKDFFNLLTIFKKFSLNNSEFDNGSSKNE